MSERTLGFPTPGLSAHPPWPARRILPVFGRRGMVGAAHPLVASAGAAVLAQGGNAVDAAVAAGLAAAVVMPEMCGLGGDLFAIVHSGDTRAPPLAFLGSGAAPMATSLAMMREHGDKGPDGEPRMPLQGPLSIGVPGMIDGYGALLARFGSWTFARAAERAIALADGVALSMPAAHAIRHCQELLRRNARAAAIFLPGGEPPRAGSVLAQPELAATLRLLAREGPRAFYEGDLARRIADGVQAVGGALAASDLSLHKTVVEAPIATRYRGHTIHETGLPSQGLILLEALNIVEQADPAGLSGDERIHLFAEALKCAFTDRLSFACDPKFGPDVTPRLISKAWAAERFASINPDRSAEDARVPAMADGDTTYITVADGDGMMVSLIQSVSLAFGSGVVAGDTGVLLNDRAGRGFSLEEGDPNVYAPGKRTLHTLNCYLVTDDDGAPVLAGGTPGGDGQPQWNLQVLSGLIDQGLDVQLAAEAPRWEIHPGTDPHKRPQPFELVVEGRIGEEALTGLERRGHRLRRIGDWACGGAVQLIARDPKTGVLTGGSDPRVEGMAIAL
jgi:gamma-glutamyltranspeptidase